MSERGKRRSRAPAQQREESAPVNREHRRMIAWLKTVRFKKKLFGGVSERDVWKKIEELNGMYNLALMAERARYDALLQEQAERARLSAGFDTENSGEEERKL